jgi:hypothetical protein
MQPHRSISICMTVCFLTGLAGCAGDSAKSTSDTVASSAVVQSEEGKDLPASDEVQERAVSRMGAATLKPIVPLSPPASLPGEFIITPALHGALFTAVDGTNGGRYHDGGAGSHAQSEIQDLVGGPVGHTVQIHLDSEWVFSYGAGWWWPRRLIRHRGRSASVSLRTIHRHGKIQVRDARSNWWRRLHNSDIQR